MSVHVSSWVWKSTTAAGNDLLVLLALADNADDEGWAFPGADALATKTRLSRATLFRRLDTLEAAELVERYRRGRTKTTVYRVAVPWSDVTSWPAGLGDPPAEVKSQIETSVKSQNETSEVSPVRPVKSHGRDLEPSVEPSDNHQSERPSRRRKPETTLPEDWKPNSAHAAYASQRNLDLSSEAFRFRAHADANDRRQRDWDAAFRLWLSKARPVEAPQRRSSWDRAVPMGDYS